jgi:hypothetical protein
MTNLTAPPVPELSSDWITARRNHLVQEITTPRHQHQPVSRRLAVRGAGVFGSVGAATAAALVAFGGTGPTNAFAGWSATPTTPASGETAAALAQCTSRLASRGQSGVPAASWIAVVTDTRGPFTAMILDSDSATATCLSGPSFTTTQASNAQGGGMVLRPGSATPPSVSMQGLGAPGSGPISHATQSQLTPSGGQPCTFLQGRVAADVTRVTLVLSDGSSVQATIADGSVVAWWPGIATATSAQLASASGTTTQHLAVRPQSPSTN